MGDSGHDPGRSTVFQTARRGSADLGRLRPELALGNAETLPHLADLDVRASVGGWLSKNPQGGFGNNLWFFRSRAVGRSAGEVDVPALGEDREVDPEAVDGDTLLVHLGSEAPGEVVQRGLRGKVGQHRPGAVPARGIRLAGIGRARLAGEVQHLPSPALDHSRTSSLHRSTGALISTPIVISNLLMGRSSRGIGKLAAALLTRMSTPPRALSACRANRSISASLVRSAGMARALPPDSWDSPECSVDGAGDPLMWVIVGGAASDDDRGPLLRQSDGDSPAYTAAGARDQGYLSFEVRHVRPAGPNLIWPWIFPGPARGR